MNDSFERFDMTAPPVRTKWYLRPLTYLFSLPSVISHGSIIKKEGVSGLKPPYIMLCNHNAFLDFKVATVAIFPHRANYIVAIDGFIGREKLLRNVGGVCKRKFTSDLRLIRNLIQVKKNGDVLIIYPEARYSLCGTTAVLPESLGKFCKMMKLPVVSFICHGHHMTSPFWNLHDRHVKPVEAEMKLLFSEDDFLSMSTDEINRKIVDAFQYDDYEWLRERGIKITYKGRAEGLHSVLYQCPACLTEFKMKSERNKLICSSCNKSWTLDEFCTISGDDGITEFEYVPDWYEWERENVKREVAENRYSTGVMDVHVDSLPNAKRFIKLGRGTMIHDMNGFKVEVTAPDGSKYEMDKPVKSMYSCHIEYNYLGRHGDCVDLNTLDDTWYVYPENCLFSVTKMALATEELYSKHLKDIGKEVVPGTM